MEIAFILVGLGIILFIVAITKRESNSITIEPKYSKEYLEKYKNSIPAQNKKIREVQVSSNLIFIIPIAIFIIFSGYRNFSSKEEPQNKSIQTADAQQTPQINQIQNQKVIYREPTPEEEQAYMQENSLIKLGNEYHWCGLKETEDILPVTKALDMGCQDDFCRIEKYYNYVKNIPYERGTQNQDKTATDVMKQWKGDCDERSYLLASMIIANGYKIILIYTKDHTLTALNIPNYDSNDNRAYVLYQGRKYYIAETTDPNGQIGAYNKNVMQNIKYIYDINEKRVAKREEIHIQLFV